MQQESLAVNFGLKEKRAQFDVKNRFSVEEVKSELLDKLKAFTVQAVGGPFTAKMYSADFKLHCECVDALTALVQAQPDSVLEILDLIFKWSAVRLLDSSNTKFATNILDFFGVLFQHLREVQYCLWEFEAAVIVPLLCTQTAVNNNLLKEKVKKLLRMVFDIYDKQKCYNLLIQYGVNNKNLTAQGECLDEVAEFITKNGIDYCSEKEMKLVAKMADHSSKLIRENALKMLGEAYKHLDENIWRVIGDVTPKVQGFLEGRFKKIKGVPLAGTL